MALLEVNGLRVSFPGQEGEVRAVAGVDLAVEPGEVVGLVGESGCGKSATALAIMGLIEPPGAVSAGAVSLDGESLLAASPRRRRQLLGREMAMVFQEPTSSLNPCFTVGAQIEEVLRTHTPLPRRARRDRILELMGAVGIPDPAARLGAYPHQLSGGMNQRVMIAMAIACRPRLLIADEPTTALDVTIQAQILDLLQRLQAREGMALLLITHDLAVLSQVAGRVLVMYAGQVVEAAPLAELVSAPRHPYTAALLASIPGAGHARGEHLDAIPGNVPDPARPPAGCRFHPRCPRVQERCRLEAPALEAGPRAVRCHFPLEPGAGGSR